ncbi:hypothetical protein Sked_11960 [Sanguibacter keddieii DSM 10542]|uniref:Uncharacterized protein n=1 Tax=Sanguibacter keddieii (strain ATCC 51767 / DSM 10542 / NCFB 3025 / ST-74) TaxID=446469 RepID=D1BE61_SANKS|nr:hypothetical protein [Sanguibacter keddieii]ACZ21139.1 hypothetical protein Sked_11960 [Sanguibacter keddieii DSM 10542]
MPSRVDTLPDPASSEPDRTAESRAAAQVLEVLGLGPEASRHVVQLVASESGVRAERLGDSVTTADPSPDMPRAASAGGPTRLVRYRAVDREGAVLYLPTLDVREIALACAGETGAVPQSTVSETDEVPEDAWVDGLAGYDDARPLLELAPEVLETVGLLVLANPLAAAGGHATVRVLLLDAQGSAVARGSLLRDLFGSQDFHEADGLVRALGLRCDGGWLVADTGTTEIFRAARLRPAEVSV